MRVSMLFPAMVAACLGLPSAALAGLTAVVIEVADGDTLVVRMNDHVLRVDLRDVDAPDPGQPFSSRSRESLAEICRRGAVLEDFGIAAERHVVADVHCDGIDAAAEQVRRGFAAVDAASAPADSPLHTLQREARTHGSGMWGAEAPQAPAQ